MKYFPTLKEAFGSVKEDAFSNAWREKTGEDQIEDKPKINLPSKAPKSNPPKKSFDPNKLDEPFKNESHDDHIVPLDALERVQIIIHPDDESEMHDSSEAGTFAAPGGPGFDQPEYGNCEDDDVLMDMGTDCEPDMVQDSVDRYQHSGDDLGQLLAEPEDENFEDDDPGLANLHKIIAASEKDSYSEKFHKNPNNESSYQKEAVNRIKSKLVNEVKKEAVNRIKSKLVSEVKK